MTGKTEDFNVMSYLLIGAGIWFLIWISGGKSGGGSSARPVNGQVVTKPEQPIASLPGPKSATLLARLSDGAEKMHEKSVTYRDDSAFDLSYCGWFRKFKILVEAKLETAKFRIDQQEIFENDPMRRAIYERLAGPTLTLEQILNGEGALNDTSVDREQLLHGNLPPPPQTDDPIIGPRQLAIYQRRLREHDEYVQIIRKVFLEKPNLHKLFFISIKKLPEEPYVVGAFMRHQIGPTPLASIQPNFGDRVVTIPTTQLGRGDSVDPLPGEAVGRISASAWLMKGMAVSKALSDHQVEKILHFTRAQNLAAILEYGILPISTLKDKDVHAVVNDTERRDSKLNAISLSLSFPNQLMFYKYRKGASDTDWVVFEISKSALMFQRSAFYRTNAAHHKMRDLDVSACSRKEAIDALFDETQLRRPPYLRSCDPTDVQAEIMLFGYVSPSNITRIIFETEESASRWSDLTGSHNVAVAGRGQGYFGTREKFLS